MSSQQRDHRAAGRASVCTVLLVAFAMVLGGGGSPAPLPETALQVLAAFLFAAWAISGQPRAQGTALVLALLLLVLPVVQLIPLPPSVWHALPGRDLERAALALVGDEYAWRPLSLSPARTLASLLALVPPAMVLVMTASLGRGGRDMVVAMIAAVSAASLVVGAGQMAGGSSNPLGFYSNDIGYLLGFQANHNSTADVLLIGMVAVAAAIRTWIDRHRPALSPNVSVAIVAAATAFMSLGVFLTASRAGIALLPVAWLGIGALVRPWLRLTRKHVAVGLLGACSVVAAAAVLAASNTVVRQVLHRWDFTGEFRPQLWIDSLYAARAYFPVGAGLGAFVPVFLAAERLEVVDETLPNRAHNDYLELAIEGGAMGYVILAIVTTILGRLAWRALRQPDQATRNHAYFAVAAFCVIALHSQVDYPLRSMSLACIAAAAAGLLVPRARGTSARWGSSERT